MAADRGEALQVLDRLLAACLAARAQLRAEQLLEQRGLAVGRGAEDAQVAPGDAEARELGGRADDLEVGLVVGLAAVPAFRGDDAELLQLAQELVADPGLGEQLLAAEAANRLADGRRAPLLARRCARGSRRPGLFHP